MIDYVKVILCLVLDDVRYPNELPALRIDLGRIFDLVFWIYRQVVDDIEVEGLEVIFVLLGTDVNPQL